MFGWGIHDEGEFSIVVDYNYFRSYTTYALHRSTGTRRSGYCDGNNSLGRVLGKKIEQSQWSTNRNTVTSTISNYKQVMHYWSVCVFILFDFCLSSESMPSIKNEVNICFNSWVFVSICYFFFRFVLSYT